MEVRVLVVCTGNVCRSPIAEQVLRARLAAAGVDATVSSAGTAALVGAPMTEEAAARSRRLGGDPSGHIAVEVTAEMLRDVDLVLTATRAHRAAVARLEPRAIRRSFTLLEFSRLAAAGAAEPVDGFVEYVAAVAAARGIVPPPLEPADDDIVDPYGRGPGIYDVAASLIDRAVDQVVRALAAVPLGRTGVR
ncbi:low molecular weight phosphatase family protein [Agromyces sp. MMS24-K17]|uniref:arsenate reductase/protein-tyrosine-phosphatase family protein n=1 Tax=Agromyces sp. MMS24-K17 TaxID=3372850 RepID=UPI003754B36B